jgi:L-fucose isomerase-like protein
VEKAARMKAVIQKWVKEANLGALAIHCWPTGFEEYDTAICSVLSLFTDEGIVASCEADIGGAVSMFMLREISGGIPYLGDLVNLNEERNSITFWHCGAGACSLAHPDQGACAGRHPIRGLGLTLEFGLRPGRVTVCRFGKTSRGYRLFIMSGEAMNEPQKYLGTSVEVRSDGDAARIVHELMEGGWEPHYAVIHANLVSELKIAADWLGIEIKQC